MSILFMSLFFLSSCSKSSSPEPPDPPILDSFAKDDLPATDNTVPTTTITWSNTAKKISHEVYSAEYGRIKKLGGDTLMLVYHFGPQGNEWDNIALRKSFDGGQNWTNAEVIMEDRNTDHYGFANPDLQVLNNGWILLAFTKRGQPDINSNSNIQIRISKDRGTTWEGPRSVATGRSWEPATIQYDDGTIQIFYSSEAQWWNGIGSTNVQQEILMVSSKDNGITWSNPKQVAYTSGMRDGMATPLILRNNKGIVFPIESVNNSKSPWIVWSSAIAKFNYKNSGTSQNGRRWLATTENVWGGAPYIIQLHNGETLLSFQDAGGRNIGSNWKKSTMFIMTGNGSARNFTNLSNAWPGLPVEEGAYYSSMFQKNEQTIVMVTTRNLSDGHSEIWWKEGTIND